VALEYCLGAFCTNTRSSQRRKLCAYPADATGNRKAQLRVHFDRGRVLRVYSPNHHVLTRGASSGDKLFDDLTPNPAPLGIWLTYTECSTVYR